MKNCCSCGDVIDYIGERTDGKVAAYICINETCEYFNRIQSIIPSENTSKISPFVFIERISENECLVKEIKGKTKIRLEMIFNFQETFLDDSSFKIAMKENYENFIKNKIDEALIENNRNKFNKWSKKLYV